MCLLLDTLSAAGVAANEKDLEIALLRQQLRILERKASSKPRLSRPETLMLVALAAQLRGVSQHFRSSRGQCVLLVKPDTLLRWDQELVRRKWTFQRQKRGGRPPVEAELESLILRLARENPRMGFDKIQGELLKLGYQVDRSTVRNVVRRNHLPPATARSQLLAHLPQPLSRANARLRFLHHRNDHSAHRLCLILH